MSLRGTAKRQEGQDMGPQTILSLLLEHPEHRTAIRAANGQTQPATYGNLLYLVTGPGRLPIAGGRARPVVACLLDKGPLAPQPSSAWPPTRAPRRSTRMRWPAKSRMQ